MSLKRTIIVAAALGSGASSVAALTDGQSRFFDWSKSIESSADKPVSVVMSDMLDGLDGCVLPDSSCLQLVEIAESSRNSVRFIASLNALAVGMDGLFQSHDCEQNRSGFPVTGPSLSAGDDFFIVMTSAQDTDSGCFIRKVGIE